MPDTANQVPDPLRRFDAAVPSLRPMFEGLDSLRAAYANLRASGRVLANVLEAVRIELTYNSNAIEGNTLSLRDTQLVIEGIVPGGQRPMRELYEARNHDRALRMIEQWVATRPGSSPITESDLLEVHATVLADIHPRAAGRLRTERVLIAGTGFVPPGSHHFDRLVPAMLALANEPKAHPALGAAELHYNLVAIHPFIDGNGRTARLMMNYYLLRFGYPPIVIELSRRQEYLESLDRANGGDIEPFARFVASSVEASLRRIVGD